MFGSIGIPEITLVTTVMAIYLAILVWPAARICQRVGFSPWLGALALIPVANVLLLWYVAMMPWPAEYQVGATLTRPLNE